MATPKKNPMGKHFQNDQRRHNEIEAESLSKRNCGRTEQTDAADAAEDCLGAVGGGQPGQDFSLPRCDVVPRNRQPTGSARSPVTASSFGQPSGRFVSPFDTPTMSYGQSGMNEVTHLGLPVPADIDREFQIALQQIPEHLRLQFIFNQWPHQRTTATNRFISEGQQYEIEQKKNKARLVLARLSDELHFEKNLVMDEKVIERIIERLEGLFHAKTHTDSS